MPRYLQNLLLLGKRNKPVSRVCFREERMVLSLSGEDMKLLVQVLQKRFSQKGGSITVLHLHPAVENHDEETPEEILGNKKFIASILYGKGWLEACRADVTLIPANEDGARYFEVQAVHKVC